MHPATIVYILCALTSVGCAILLLRSYARTRARLLFWSGLCFLCLGLSNSLLFVDLILLPEVDLSPYRLGITLLGVLMLLYGLICETK
jgi:hypothetical protein